MPYFIDKSTLSDYAISYLMLSGGHTPRQKRVRRKLLSVYLPEPLIRVLSEVGDALHRAASKVGRSRVRSVSPEIPVGLAYRE